MKEIVIVGGGTVGWLTALYVQKYWNNVEVTLIASSKIGILGAGESSAANFPGILKELDINETDFLKATNATLKVGNNFVNWRGDDKTLIHPFMGDSSNPKTPIHGFHFDAQLVAKYFKNIALERGVKYIDSEITNFNQSSNGDINSIKLIDNSNISVDFVFDCSGFSRLIIGKLFKDKWNSYRDYLKIDTAIAYFLPQKNNLKYNEQITTQSIAMKYGWMWQIQLQHRWGCGYAFDSNYTNEIDAKKEVEEYIGQEIDIVKTFNFNPGSYENAWISNCIAIGLSVAFLEPLEATSILSSIMMLRRLRLVNFNLNYKDNFNKFVRNINEQNMLFIRYQYMCDRNDTEFWRNQKNVKVPLKLTKIINKDNKLIVKNNDEIMKAFDLVDGDDLLIFGYENYNTVFKKNSKNFSNLLI